jgi:hypothetical protein
MRIEYRQTITDRDLLAPFTREDESERSWKAINDNELWVKKQKNVV